MNKEQAMTILNLKEGFTYDDLNEAYKQLAPKAIEYHAKHNGRNRDIIEAYKFLKENKLYGTIDVSGDFTILSQRSKEEKLQYVMSQIEEARESIANIIKSLDVFIKISDDDFDEDMQMSIFINVPEYLKTYAINLKAKAEDFKNAHSNFRKFSDLANFIDDYGTFNSYVEKCYKEIILEVLKDNNIVGWNAEYVFKNIFWQNINSASEALENVFYRSYLGVKDFYEKVIQEINKNAQLFQGNFNDRIEYLFESWRDFRSEYRKHFYHVDYDQVLKKATNKLKKELASYASYQQISAEFLDTRFLELLDFYAKQSADQNYETDVKTIWKYKMNAYYNESFGSFFVIGEPLIEESQNKVKQKYDFNSKVFGSKKVKEIEDYIDSLLLEVVKKGQKLFYQIKALMDKYPEFGSYVRDKNYKLNDIYQKFDGELLAKLKEIIPTFDSKELDSLSLNEQLTKDDYQQITSFEEQIDKSTYLIYLGHDITWEDINNKMAKYSRNDEQARMIFEDGIIFAKNVTIEDIKNNNVFEPAIYKNYCWTITDFNFEELKELVQDSKAVNTCELLKGLLIFNTNNVLKYLERNIDFSCFSYNYLTNRLLIIVNNSPVYIGYPNEGEIMYSNNASLLKELCPVVYKLPLRSYSLNEELYEKKDGFDLIVKSLKL